MPLTRNVIYIINSHLTSVLSSQSPDLVSVTYLRHTGPVSVCSTPSCLESSAHIIGAMNTSHDPCSDMWSYACGGWTEKHSIPQSRWVNIHCFTFSKYVIINFRSKWSLSMEIEQRVRTEKSRLISMFSHEPSQVWRRTDNILILLNPVDNYSSS